MAGKIPQSFIDELLNRTDIISLIDAYVPLRKKGANYTACCPFHQEKTPSFIVSPQKQIYHCFGCGVGGNAIRFLMEYEHAGFTEAIALLAKQAGLDMPENTQSYMAVASPLYDVMQQVAQYYQQQLKQSQAAITYFKSRGITGVLAKEYQLGFAPNGWNNLSEQLGRDEKMRAMLLQAGLMVKKDSGNSYDRFRARVMFPIRDTKGRVIAFGGRVLNQEEPKYLNSPETPLFHKGRELYGLYEARKALRDIDYFLVVEGYMDVLALVQYGIRNVVGTLGTATTAEHLTKLLRYSKKIVFCFDGDRAGKEAAWRALQTALPFLQDGVQMRFMFLPDKADPDSFIRQYGKQKFLAAVNKATSFSDFLFSHVAENLDLSTLEGKASLSHLVTPLLDKMPEGALKQMMYENMSRLVPLDATQLRSLSKQAVSDIKAQLVQKKSGSVKQGVTLMQMVIMLLLQHPQLASYVATELSLAEWEHAGADLLKEILQLMSQEPQLTSAALLEHWQDKPAYRVISALLMKEHLIPEEEVEQEFVRLLWRLEQQHQESKIEKMLLKAKTQGLEQAEKLELQKLIAESKV